MDREMIRRIMIAVNEIDGACALISKTIGVKENTLTLLYALDDGQPHSQKEISQEWFLPKTTLNTIVKECEEAGYLVLQSAEGSREKALCLTEAGRRYAGNVLTQVHALEDLAAGSAGLTEELIVGLSQFAKNYTEEATKLHHGTT